MRRILADYRVFLREFRRTFHTTGAILPSSPLLARALARYVDPAANERGDAVAGRRILGVGPGTGAVTRQIVKRMTADDRLDLVELNDTFVDRLEKQFASDPLLESVAQRTRIIHRPIQDVEDSAAYDLIVSGLPLNNFAVQDVRTILDAFHRLAKPGGKLSFFEYIGVRPLRGAVSRSDERQRLRGIGDALRDLFTTYEIRRQAIWLNVPPAWVHHIQFAQQTVAD